MRRFAELYATLDSTTKTGAKVDAMVAYFQAVPSADAAWALFFLTGQRLKRLISSRTLRLWALEATGLPDWLVDESYAAVGDTAETVALLLDALGTATPAADSLSVWMDERILPLRGASDDEQRRQVVAWWRALDREQRFLLNKLLTGGFRVGVAKGLVVRAVAKLAALEPAVVSHRLMGQPAPTPAFFAGLIAGDDGGADDSRPYPFFLASPLEQPPTSLGRLDDWLAEWKWDGIRGQLVKRRGAAYLWSRGEDLVTERFPEIVAAAGRLADGTVLDGEILAWRDDVLPFALLQKRIGRLRLDARTLREAPARFLAYDLLEADGVDLRAAAQHQRRSRLEAVLAGAPAGLGVSPLVVAADWEDLARRRDDARGRGVEGLMLKRRDAPYQVGRRRGDWWKWKVDPLSVDAVLVYAQAGSGRRANLFTDYTFAVWEAERLVPFAKAYSGLDDSEIRELDRWIRRHTVERFGPVRSVPAAQVFEVAFEGIQRSPRHKSGIAVRFPRIARWRRDKRPADADTLASLRDLLHTNAEATRDTGEME
ncbi:MAG: ATP-dependent DNA ligase [Pseudomonadota bacterium]